MRKFDPTRSPTTSPVAVPTLAASSFVLGILQPRDGSNNCEARPYCTLGFVFIRSWPIVSPARRFAGFRPRSERLAWGRFSEHFGRRLTDVRQSARI
jgi:hypothetical protein